MHPEINSTKWWYLDRLEYTTDELQVWIIEGIPAQSPNPVEIAGHLVSSTCSVGTGAGSRRFLITFSTVISYRVSSESYSRIGEHDQRTPGNFTRYSASEFLDFTHASTLLTSYHEVMPRGEYHHHALLLLDDIIDVISYGEPHVQKLEPVENS